MEEQLNSFLISALDGEVVYCVTAGMLVLLRYSWASNWNKPKNPGAKFEIADVNK